MTTLAPEASTSDSSLSIKEPRLPARAPLVTAAGATVGGVLLGLALGWGPVAMVLLAGLLNLVVLQGWSRVVESRRVASDRLVTTLVWYALVVALVPLCSLVWTVV